MGDEDRNVIFMLHPSRKYLSPTSYISLYRSCPKHPRLTFFFCYCDPTPPRLEKSRRRPQPTTTTTTHPRHLRSSCTPSTRPRPVAARPSAATR